MTTQTNNKDLTREQHLAIASSHLERARRCQLRGDHAQAERYYQLRAKHYAAADGDEASLWRPLAE